MSDTKPRLYASLRSPFARRLRVAMDESGFDHEVKFLDVFHPPADFWAVNPLGRVPALELPTGERIIDSNAIYAYLRARLGNHSLFLHDGELETQALNYSGVAVGMMELVVSYFLETLRPDGMRSQEDLEDFRMRLKNGVRFLAENLKGQYLSGDKIKSWDLDAGVALAYCDFRVGRDLIDAHPPLREYLKRLEARPSFQKSVPPPA